MMTKKRLIRNKTTARVLLVLILGTCIIQGALLVCFGQYLRHSQIITPPTNSIINDIHRTVKLANTMSIPQLKKNIPLLQIRTLRVNLADKSIDNALVLDNFSFHQLETYIKNQHRSHLKISVAIEKNHWINISSVKKAHPFLGGYLVVIAALFIALLLLYLWSANHLSIPFNEFLTASQRFGIDLQAPPMALQGSDEMREAIQAFNEMQARIRRLVSDRTQMLAAISHDLRTPITRLQLRAEYLKGQDQYEKALADLNEMDKMISSILAFSRDYASTEALERFDINALLETLCDDLVDTGKTVNYQNSSNRIAIDGRMMAIKRALTNLIENAVKYGKQADVTIEQSKQALHIKISDQGPGIPEHETDKVFEPFYRIDSARSPEQSGSGLGMAVARDIIRAHGGDIELSNNTTGGLTVAVTLPLH